MSYIQSKMIIHKKQSGHNQLPRAKIDHRNKPTDNSDAEISQSIIKITMINMLTERKQWVK